MKKPSNSSLCVWLLVGISLSLNLYQIQWGLPTGDRDWSPDSVAPLKPLAYAKSLVDQEPWVFKYPPFHFMVLSVFYAPYVLYLYLTDGIAAPTGVYPYGLKDPEVSLMVFTLIARITSAVMGTGTVLVSYYTVKILYGWRAGLISALLIASSYAIIYYSHNANVDVPQLFWISLALFSFVSLLKAYKTKYYLLLGLFAALAIGTKDSAYALFLGIAPVLLYFHLQHEQAANGKGRVLSALVDRKLLYGFSTFVIVLIMVFNVPFNWQGFAEHVQFHLGKSMRANRVIREAASVFQGDLTLIGRYLLYIVEANGLPSFLLLVGGFLYCLFKFPGKSWMFLVLIGIYYIFFLRIRGGPHLRYVLPLYLLLTWQAGKFASDLMDLKKIGRALSIILVSLVLVHSLVYGFSVDLLLARDPRYTAEEWMERNIPREATILAVDPDYSLPRFPQGRDVRYRTLWSDSGRETNIMDLNPDYIVIGMSLPRRLERKSTIEAFFSERGYQPVASFKSEIPFGGAEIVDLHAVNQHIVVFRRS